MNIIVGEYSAELFFGIDISNSAVDKTVAQWVCQDIKARGLPFLRYHQPNETVDTYIEVYESHTEVDSGGKSVGDTLIPNKEWTTALLIFMEMLHIEKKTPSYFIVGCHP